MLNPFDPMPTIKAILGMPIYEAVKESQILAHLDDFDAPQCENACHAREPDHHSGAAAFLFIAPCAHGTGYVCAPFVQWLLSDSRVRCGTCDLQCAPTDLTFIPIGGAL